MTPQSRIVGLSPFGEVAQALARVTAQGQAHIVDRDSEKSTDARDVYLARFPDAAALFDFSDFNILIVKPVFARVIAAFGQAMTITGEDFAVAVSTAT